MKFNFLKESPKARKYLELFFEFVDMLFLVIGVLGLFLALGFFKLGHPELSCGSLFMTALAFWWIQDF